MERYAVLVLFVSAGAELLSPQVSKKYRDDYVYSQRANAFFKLHPEEVGYRTASKVCRAEGAALVVPSSIQDTAEVHALFKQFPDIGDFVWIGDDGEVHESAEEEAVIKFTETEVGSDYDFTPSPKSPCTVLTREGEIQSHSCSSFLRASELPFACKVDAASAPYDAQCGVYAKDYVYKPSVGSCYKVSNAALAWNQAYSECTQEGAHLVVINSQAESDVVKRLMNAAPLLSDAHSPYYYIVGIRAGKDRVFKTVFNQTLEEAGFAEWADTEPNNIGGNEYCGSLYGDGKYNDHDCSKPYGFICEKERSPQ